MSKVKMTGGCACGAVKYEIKGEPVRVVNCHCRDCQRSSGASMATVLSIPKTDFEIKKGVLHGFEYIGDSGGKVTRQFCPVCGNPLFSELESRSEFKFVRVASLDDPDAIIPTMNIYCGSARAWGLNNNSLPKYKKYP